MAASLWLRLPSPPLQNLLLPSSTHSSSSASPLQGKKHAVTSGNLHSSSSLVVCSSSSSPSSIVTKEQEGAIPAPPTPVSDKDDPNFRGCKGCGREEQERGCNGEGRMQGGLAAIPGLGWWPIKAYRPCPGFVASGGRYRRYGQSMDDVISGKAKKIPSSQKKSDQ